MKYGNKDYYKYLEYTNAMDEITRFAKTVKINEQTFNRLAQFVLINTEEFHKQYKRWIPPPYIIQNDKDQKEWGVIWYNEVNYIYVSFKDDYDYIEFYGDNIGMGYEKDLEQITSELGGKFLVKNNYYKPFLFHWFFDMSNE